MLCFASGLTVRCCVCGLRRVCVRVSSNVQLAGQGTAMIPLFHANWLGKSETALKLDARPDGSLVMTLPDKLVKNQSPPMVLVVKETKPVASDREDMCVVLCGVRCHALLTCPHAAAKCALVGGGTRQPQGGDAVVWPPQLVACHGGDAQEGEAEACGRQRPALELRRLRDATAVRVRHPRVHRGGHRDGRQG